MKPKEKLKKFLLSDWFIAFILLAVFLLSAGYKYGWDDQHLEIPLLKSLIDPTLYVGDYYVESLKKNFPSFFYPILAKLITVQEIPLVYFILYLVSRYFLFFWIYKLWLLIDNDKLKSFSCVLVFLLVKRVDELLYRTFSHQEFALAIIFAGIYYFLKGRFLLASILFGLSSNIHALYSLFPMIYLSSYLLWKVKEKGGFKRLCQCLGAFVILALPFLLWMLKKALSVYASYDPKIYEGWLDIYYIANPQNFLFLDYPFHYLLKNVELFFEATEDYLVLMALFILNLCFNPKLRNNSKAVVFCVTGFLLLLVCLVFTHITPNKFILDLNLPRNWQYLYFLLFGFNTLLMIDTIENKSSLIGLSFALTLMFIKFNNFVALCGVSVMFFILVVDAWAKKKNSFLKFLILSVSVVLIILLLWGVNYNFSHSLFRTPPLQNLTIAIFVLGLLFFIEPFLASRWGGSNIKKLYYLIPLTIFFLQFTSYQFEEKNIEKTAQGYWRLQRNWEDVQEFVKGHLPKDATLLVPYDMEMGGFRIHSERKVVVCYRDCGIVGFDYKAVLEWQKRIKDIEAFKISIKQPLIKAVQNAVTKYGADYILFMRYALPENRSKLLELVYSNTDFVLYKIKTYLLAE